MKTLTLLLLFAFPFFSFGQDLADNNTLIGNSIPRGNATTATSASGKTATPTGKTATSSANNINVMTAMMEALHSKMPGTAFGIDCHFAEQHAELTITANDLQPLVGHLAVGRLQFLTMEISPAIKNGAPYFESTGVDGNVTVRRWLITTGIDELPYEAVTRKEYLQAAKVELAGEKGAIVAAVKEKVRVRPTAVQEAEKKATIEQLKAMYTGTVLEVRLRQYLKNYRTDEQFQQDNIDNEATTVDNAMRLMNDLLTHMPATELNKPAVVSVPAIDFNGFEDGHTDKMLVRMNPTYYNGERSAEKPRVLLVEWRYDASTAGASEIDQQLMENFDAQALRTMLGGRKEPLLRF
jgi:hypothetical protein